nr:hypothetical protein [uncultured Rhodopila sp.]
MDDLQMGCVELAADRTLIQFSEAEADDIGLALFARNVVTHRP